MMVLLEPPAGESVLVFSPVIFVKLVTSLITQLILTFCL